MPITNRPPKNLKCRFKFNGWMSFNVESKLINKYGFRVHSRKHGQWIILEKESKPGQPVPEVPRELPEHIQRELVKRCNAVIDVFMDPTAHARQIRIRLENICKAVPPSHEEFIRKWMDRNIEKVNM